MKVAHVFSDEKFIDKHIIKYASCDFHNTFFYLKDEDKYEGVNREDLCYVKPNSTSYFHLIDNIDQYDILILYYLNWEKLDLLEAISWSKVKIIWSFYGVELYDLPAIRYQMLSKRTQEAIGMRRYGLNVDRLREWIKVGIHAVRNKRTKAQRIRKACKRIDYFLWYNRFEYDYLNSLVNNILPPFMQSTLNNKMDWVVPNHSRGNSIIIGNSASHYINHLDAIELIQRAAYKGDISIPFSYGVKPVYNKKVKEAAALSGLKIQFIEQFVSYEEFIEMVNNHSAAIYPSFRQMGLGNIFIAIRCGLKIYLSEKNPTLIWLRDKGMKIFSIESELRGDLREGRLKLDPDDIHLNNEIYSTMVDFINDRRYFVELREILV